MATPVEIIHAVVAELRSRGIPVQFEPGWETRGRPRPFTPRGLVIHHTATLRHDEDYPSMELVRDGDASLIGPRAQFGLGRHTGTVFVIAAGNANHAGEGGFNGMSGNEPVWGIEAENDGRGEPWSAVALRNYVVLAGALARHTGFGPEMICAHREWNPKDKSDPRGIDADQFRRDVAAYLSGDVLQEDERNAVLFAGGVLQELKQGQWFVAEILSRLDDLNRRLEALTAE